MNNWRKRSRRVRVSGKYDIYICQGKVDNQNTIVLEAQFGLVLNWAFVALCGHRPLIFIVMNIFLEISLAVAKPRSRNNSSLTQPLIASIITFSSLATISRSLSTSERLFLVCSTANGFHGYPLGTIQLLPLHYTPSPTDMSCSCLRYILFSVFILRCSHPDAYILFLILFWCPHSLCLRYSHYYHLQLYLGIKKR